MKIMMVRSLKGYPDSRVEKEIFSLSKENKVFFLGWNRDGISSTFSTEKVSIYKKLFRFFHYNSTAPIGLGFKALFFPLLSFWYQEFRFLVRFSKYYEAIHACDFDTIIPAFFVAKMFRKKIVYDIFDYYSDSHSAPVFIKKIIRLVENYFINRCDVVIICSEKRKEQIIGTHPKKLEVVHNSPILTDKNEIQKENAIIATNKFKIVYIGVLTEDRYLKEMASVISGRNDVELHIGGWGVLEDYFKNMSDCHDNIIYYGKIPYQKVIDIEKQCDLITALYNPSTANHKYAAPNKFYESIMLGKPVVMLKNTGMDCYVEEHNIGYIIDLGLTDFVAGFNATIDYFINNKWTKASEERARSLYINQFSWDIMERRLNNIYKNL